MTARQVKLGLNTRLTMCCGNVAINFSTLMGDGIQEGFQEVAACDLSLKNQKDDAQWQSGQGILDQGNSMDRNGEARQPGMNMGTSAAGSREAWEKERNLDSSSDSASGLTSSGSRQVSLSLGS